MLVIFVKSKPITSLALKSTALFWLKQTNILDKKQQNGQRMGEFRTEY